MTDLIISLAHSKLPKVYLRPLEISDAEKCTKWINDSESRQFIGMTKFLSLGEERRWIETKENNDFVLAIITKENSIHIGNIGIDELDWVNRRCTTGTLIGEKNYLGRGFGTEAKILLLKHLFDTLGLEKICSRVHKTNPRSKAYLEKTGYKEEGCLRRHVRINGKMVDVYEMAIFREDFIPIWKKYTGEEMAV